MDNDKTYVLALSEEELMHVVEALRYSGTMLLSDYDKGLADKVQRQSSSYILKRST